MKALERIKSEWRRLLPRRAQRGVAIIMVMAVLAGLTALAAPFVFSMILHGRSARSDLNAARAKAGAEGALALALAQLQQTVKSPGFDATPDMDTLDELKVNTSLAGLSVDNGNPRGELWSAKIEDEQGKVNVNSAPPTLIGNLMNSSTLTESVNRGSTTLLVDDPDAFYSDGDPSTIDGWVSVGGDTAPYTHVEGNTIALKPTGTYSLERSHRQGSLVFDGRATFISDYKFVRGRDDFRPFRSTYEIKAISNGAATLAIRPDEFAGIERFITIHSGRSGQAWGHAERIGEQSFDGDRQTFTVENPNGFSPGTMVRFFQAGRTITYGRVDAVGISRRNNKAFVRLEEDVGVGASGSGVGNDIFMVPMLYHPININTAPPEVIQACFTGLALAGRTEAVTREQAWNLANFLSRRVYRDQEELRVALEEAQSKGLLSGGQRDAVFVNATEFNSPKLATSTVPFCYRSHGSFTIEGSCTVHTDTGVPLARSTMRQIVSMPTPPPGDFEVKTQKDWQDLVDQGLSQHIITWPEPMGPNTNRFRRVGYVPEASSVRGDARLDVGEVGTFGYRNEYVDHCDNPQDPGYFQEGYDLSKRDTWKLPGVQAVNRGRNNQNQTRANPMPAGAFDMWFKPFGGGQVVFFDQGEVEDRNRVTFLYDPGRGLVVRIYDANLEGKFVEYIYPEQLDASQWYHVAASWHSSHMNGQEVRLDGQFLPKNNDPVFKPGTRLAMDIDDEETTGLEVEDGADFPDAGAVIIGEEIIEYHRKSGNRLMELVRGQRMSAAAAHIEGEFVMPYGYTVGINQDLRVGGATLVERLAGDDVTTTRVFVPKPPPDNIVPEDDDSKIPVLDASSFPKSGYINVSGEVIYYGNRSASAFTDLQRGLEGSTARDLRNNQTVRLCSVEVTDHSDYHNDGLIQVDSEDDEMIVEWINYAKKVTQDGKHYLLSHFHRTTGTRMTGTPPRSQQVVSLGRTNFRGEYGTNRNLAHMKKAKIIPVMRMAGPHIGGPSAPRGPDISTVSIITNGMPGGDVRWIKRGFIRQFANTRDVRDRNGNVTSREFVDWGFEYFMGLDDFVTRFYPARSSRLLKFPSGELPDNGDSQRHLCADMFGEGKVSGYVDELRANVMPSLGGRVAMNVGGFGLPGGDAEVMVELNTTWAAPTGRNSVRQGFNPNWPKSGLIRVEDELIFYTQSGNANLQYYADVHPTLELKSQRTWNNEHHPNVERKQVVRLSGLKRGVLGTQAVDHPVGAQIKIFDAAPVTVLQGGLGGTGDTFSVLDARGFGLEGYAWVGDEVVSWRERRGNSLTGISTFRGRFGTPKGTHADGEIVQALPFRYWDRDAQEYDGQGLAYLQAGYSATNAIWTNLELKAIGGSGEPLPNYVRPRVLVRFDGKPAWDSQPTNAEGGLFEYGGQGEFKIKGYGPAGGVRADEMEVRVYWRYHEGAFQPNSDWKRTFALDEMKATYFSPLILRRLEEVDRR